MTVPGYKTLDAESARQIVDQQVEQFERELFGHRLNLARLEAERKQGADVGKAVGSVEEAVAVIERAIETTEAEGQKLNGKGG